jgi:branched-chain amino acid transport system substrate-binding protein
MPFFLLYLFLALQTQKTVPYSDFSGKGAGFYGEAGVDADLATLKTVRIGVLGPAKSKDGLHQRCAVQLAIQQANAAGGYKARSTTAAAGRASASGKGNTIGIPYEMVFREDDGPWGVAARQVVQMAYEDRVWAIIGALDGQHTHMAELVVSKAWVPVVSPSASDGSIDYANVPWVFRASPSDTKQADALLDLAERRHYYRLIILSEAEREAHTGYLRLKERLARRSGLSLELHLEYSALAPAEIVPRLRDTRFDCLIIWGNAESAVPLMLKIREAGIGSPILGPASLAVQPVLERGAAMGNLTVAAACDLSRDSSAVGDFSSEFKKVAGEWPSATAFYSYDVARLIIQAIGAGGLNRAGIRNRISGGSFEGLFGRIEFNSLGGSLAPPVLLTLRENRWVRLE